MCVNINHPRDIGTIELHTLAKIDRLHYRRDLNLLCIMYDLKQHHVYERIGVRPTRHGDKYVFQTEISSTGAYTRSPYYIGAKLWNDLPMNIQFARTKSQFKNDLRTYWAMNQNDM